jgi:hypothetical protein
MQYLGAVSTYKFLSTYAVPFYAVTQYLFK